MSCKHEASFWSPRGCNEDGWECGVCRTKLGFRPDLDRERTYEKVQSILLHLHEHEIHYVSNASEGDGMAGRVANRCRQENAYDQQSIIVMLLGLDLADHRTFWRDEARKFFCKHAARSLVGGVSRCNVCGHEVKQAGSGPLFESEEPF